MKVSLLLTLEDRLSSGLTKLMDTLDRLAGNADRLAGGFTTMADKLDGIFSKTEGHVKRAGNSIGNFERLLKGLGETAGTIGAKLDGMWTGAGHFADKIGGIGGAVAGISIVEPVEQFAKYDSLLRQITVDRGLSGAAAEAENHRLSKMFAEDAQASGQSSESIARAYLDLARMNLPKSVNLDTVIGQHSKIATAYNMDPESLGHALGALLNNFGIADTEVGATMAAMAQASKRGLFKMEDFSRELPGVSGEMSLLGMTGRKGADYAFSALETVMKNSAEPNQAAIGFTDALRFITDSAGDHAFARAGIDLAGIERAGAKQGKNPMDAVLDWLTEWTKGLSPVDAAHKLGSVLHNAQAAQSMQALMQHRDEQRGLNTELDKVDNSVLDRDFNTMKEGPMQQVNLFHENIEQITRTIGEGFAPALQLVARVLGDMKDGITALNEAFPVWGPRVEAATGVVGAFGAAVGLISMVAGGPVALAIAAVVALGVAAVEIYKHWDGIKQYFADLWHGVQDAFTAWETWLGAWIDGAMTATIGRIRTAWSGLTDFFKRLWADIRAPFDAFAGDVEAVLQKVGLASKPATAGAPDATAPPPLSGGGKGLFHHSATPPAPTQLNGHITIGFDKAGAPQVRDATTNHPDLTLGEGDPNRVIGRD